MNEQELRVVNKTASYDIAEDLDITLISEYAINVIKLDPMLIGEPFIEIIPGCPMGFAKLKLIVRYNVVKPSIFDKVKMFIFRVNLTDTIDRMRGESNGI